MTMLAVSGSFFAQAPTTQREVFSMEKFNAVAEAPMQNKALGVTVFEDDFSGGSSWTIGAADLQGQWEIVTASPAVLTQYMGAMASTSNANGFGLFNGLQYLIAGSVDSQNAILTCDSIIDLSTYPDVILEFEQRYRAFNTDRTVVEFSTDGTTWTEVEINDEHAFGVTVQDVIRIDASSFIGGSSTAQIRFRWESLSGDDLYGSGYGWMVDDVSIATKPNNDIKTGDNDWGSLGLHYYQIPLSQVAPIDFWTMVSNEGSDVQTGVALNVDVNTGANTGSSAAVSVAATASDSIGITGLFTPSANGTYTFTMDITADLVDDVPGNNVLTGDSFDVNDYIYARDAGGTPGASGGEDNDPAAAGDFAFEAGSYFDAFATEPVYGIDVTIGTGTPVGTVIYGKLYEWDGTAFVYVDETAEYTTVTGDVGTEKTLLLFTQPTINAGTTYMTVVGCYSEFYYGTSGFSPDQTSFIMYGGVGGAGSQYYTNATPMVRMNFDPSIGIAEVSETGAVLGQNMPNPFDNNSTISFELTNTTDVQFEFVDMTGKVVKTMDLGTLANGTHTIQVDASEFASGVYYYSLVSEGSRVTSKMIVQK